jgi:hypothetical protein
VSLISPWGSTLSVTFSTVDGSTSVRLERNFAFFSAFSADCLERFFSGHFLFQLLYYLVPESTLLHTLTIANLVLNLFVRKCGFQ